VDFLLECIGFPPDQDLDELARSARESGESVPWRGPKGEHYRLSLGPGLDLRVDREEGGGHWTLYPHYQSNQRLRLSVHSVRGLPDSIYDALIFGWANPPLEGSFVDCDEAYPLSAVLTDRRRLPRRLEPGHVLAVNLAGFALDVRFVGPADTAALGDATCAGGETATPTVPAEAPVGRTLPGGGWIAPLGGTEDPGGCVELSLPIRAVHTLENELTGREVTMIEAEAPARPLMLFTSPWQLEGDGLPAPRAGWSVEGTFLLTGRIAGGLASPTERLGRSFG